MSLSAAGRLSGGALDDAMVAEERLGVAVWVSRTARGSKGKMIIYKKVSTMPNGATKLVG